MYECAAFLHAWWRSLMRFVQQAVILCHWRDEIYSRYRGSPTKPSLWSILQVYLLSHARWALCRVPSSIRQGLTDPDLHDHDDPPIRIVIRGSWIGGLSCEKYLHHLFLFRKNINPGSLSPPITVWLISCSQMHKRVNTIKNAIASTQKTMLRNLTPFCNIGL